MDYEIMALLLALLAWAAWAITTEGRPRRQEEHGPLPPGPAGWPVVGNIFQLGWAAAAAPHVSFAQLARAHGPIMTLRLGCMTTVVVSSAAVARDMFRNHDVVLAGRKIYEAMRGDRGTDGSLITSQYGPHWRALRRLCASEFVAAARGEGGAAARRLCVEGMLAAMGEGGAGGTRAVEVGRFLFGMTFNLVGNMVLSRDVVEVVGPTGGPEGEEEKGAAFFYHAGRVMELAGRANVADFVPALRRVDPQRIRRRTQFHVERAFEITGGFIRERMEERESGERRRKKDFLDVLLEFRGEGEEEGGRAVGPTKFSSRTINVIVFEMFTAGTDTTTSTLEWAMAELLRNPQALKRAQSELMSTVSRKRSLDEDDIENLPYLRAAIKETLRLHPPLPFLVPHMAMDSCRMQGYHIPKEAQVLVNVWAIGRDPNTWEDPLAFRPERFLKPNEPEVDYKGHHFQFIPFGSGRRMCPAVPLACQLLPLALGSLLHAFEWDLGQGSKPEDMDMSERMGITLRKSIPLKAIPIPR